MKKNRLKDIYFGIFYNFFYRFLRISKKEIYLYSHGGNDIGNNFYSMLKQIDLRHSSFGIKKIIINKRCEESINYGLLKKKLRHLKFYIVGNNWARNAYHMAKAKYFFTDTSLPMTYRKKKGQTVVQTWHGTPLKKLGYANKNDIYFTGNQGKAFMMADVILFPNIYTGEKMIDSYRLHKSISGKIFYGGYPRNTILFDHGKRLEIRRKYHINEKDVFVYMPTWRGALLAKNNKTSEFYSELFAYIDPKLNSNQLLYVKLHRLDMANLDCSQFKHIQIMPEDIETYHFLTAADCLITDYSSIMFDFAVTKRKIILFPYDLKDYEAKQGFYFPYSDLPFPTAYTQDELIPLLCDSNYEIDKQFYERFCTYDSQSNTENLLKIIFTDKPIEPQNDYEDSRKKMLLYAGSMEEPEMTSQMYYLLDRIKDYYNITIAYKNEDFRRNPARIQALPPEIDFVSFDYWHGSYCRKSILETVAGIWERKAKKWNLLHSVYKRMCIREMNRHSVNQSYDFLLVYFYDETDLQILRMFANIETKKILVKNNVEKNDNLSHWLKDNSSSFDCSIAQEDCIDYLLTQK